MWTLFSEEQMNLVARQLFLPLILLINYTLLQYLVAIYWKRRKEYRMRLLFLIGFIGVACLIPFAQPDEDMVHGLNDVSESCSVVTFLIQITIIGHDLNTKFKLKSVMVLTHVAEFLILADIAMVFISFIVTFSPQSISKSVAEDIPNVFENLTVIFIFFFRFYYIGISKGWRGIVRTRKMEVLCYLLFATHELPFELLTWVSGISWEFVQALYMRLTIAGCLILTAHGKIKSSSSKGHTMSQVSARGDGHKRGSILATRLSIASARHSGKSSIQKIVVATQQEHR